MEYKEGRLGSGAVFADEAAKTREMASNYKRIEAWRGSEGYEIAARVSVRPSETPARGLNGWSLTAGLAENI